MSLHRWLIAFMTLLFIVPIIAQNENEPVGSEGIGDSYFPTMGNGGYDTQHYLIDLNVDVARNLLDSRVRITADSLQDLEQFNLDFFGFEIDSILVNDLPATFERDFGQGELIIVPQQPLKAGDRFEVIVEYQGIPPQLNTSWNNYGHGVMVAGEPTGASGWYPVNEHPSDKAAYSIIVTLDDVWSVASNGIAKDVRDNGDGTLTHIWDSQGEMASYLVTLAIGEFVVDESVTQSGIPVRNFFADGLSDRYLEPFGRQSEMIDFFETIFGPYPFSIYGSVVHDLATGFALETQTLSTFGNAFAGEGVISHELAHQWFGNSVALTQWQDIWLNEGFATYATGLWFEYTDGAEALNGYIANLYENMALREAPFEIQASGLNEYIEGLPLDDESLTRQQVLDGLEILFSNVLDAAERDEAVELLPEEGITRRQFLRVIQGIDYRHMTITRAQIRLFLRAIGLDEVADDSVVVADPTPDGLFSGVVYQRGALTLHALRLAVGDDAFFDILQTYANPLRR